MFIVHLKNGQTLVEGKNVANWDEVPDGEITSVEITLPIKRQRQLENGSVIDVPSPSIKIGKYDEYYCAYQAVAKIMTLAGHAWSGEGGGEGTITHQVLAGVDRNRGEVVYVELNVASLDIQVKKFDIADFTVAPHALKHSAQS